MPHDDAKDTLLFISLFVFITLITSSNSFKSMLSNIVDERLRSYLIEIHHTVFHIHNHLRIHIQFYDLELACINSDLSK